MVLQQQQQQQQHPAGSAEAAAAAVGVTVAAPAPAPAPARTKTKQKTKKRKEPKDNDGTTTTKKKRKKKSSNSNSTNNAANSHASLYQPEGLSAAQQAVQEQMRRALEEDQYSAVGSIVDVGSEDSDAEDHMYHYRGRSVRLDKSALQQAVRKHNLLERLGAPPMMNKNKLAALHPEDDEEDQEDEEMMDPQQQAAAKSGGNAKSSKKKKSRRNKEAETGNASVMSKDPLSLEPVAEEEYDGDGGSIFGATAGSSNSTWVECDKCKKWRRLRGVVDEKKLPSKWYCSMNKNDPDRARCSAPEEEYETPHTPESAADARTRKHLRVWVRRLQCNEAFEARQPTLTRGKKRATVSSSKDRYEWVRCCNPSCGKWRALLRSMDAKTNVIDRTTNGEWYCVMNNWDEKTASCAAPQENLPAIGCPPWVMQDEN